MKILLDGVEVELRGFISLDDEIDKAFQHFYTKFFNNYLSGRQETIDLLLREFIPSVHAFFDRNQTNNPRQDAFFTNMTFAWKASLDAGYLLDAQFLWEQLVLETRLWENKTGSRVHKGSALYFWGGTALMQGEQDKGYFLVHSAFQEDQLTSGEDLPQTPAFNFVSLEYKGDQYLREYTQSVANYFQQFFIQYRIERLSQFNLESFREKFLLNPPNVSTLFSLAHSLAKMQNWDNLPAYVFNNDFSAQQQLNLIFDLTLVIDETIRASYPNATHHTTFITYAEHIAIHAWLNLDLQDFRGINRRFNQDPERVLFDLIHRLFSLNNGRRLTPLESDLAICYCLRNRAAHRLEALATIGAFYRQICQSVANILLLAVETLY
ncbi:MAG: hypothetical protein KIT70_03020 [Anaerolineales bacterium]|nr:MAG: hypothetical protein KIT70_03020 [Anaerolineales bacterium]